MATDVDVQYFSHLNGLVLGNNWGDLINLLDTCLVNGIAFSSITSATIDANGDINLTLFSAHNAMLFQVVELSGFSPVGLNGKYRIKGVPSATQLILKANLAGTAITAVGAGKLASLGYEIVYTAQYKRVYRAKNPTAQHPYIRVDETISDGTNSYTSTYAKYAMVGLVENMGHIDDYLDQNKLQLPLDPTNFAKNWKISGTGTSVVRGWSKWYWARAGDITTSGISDTSPPTAGNRQFTLVGNKDSFYFLRSVLSSTNKILSGCGLYDSALPVDNIPNWFLSSCTSSEAVTSTSAIYTRDGVQPFSTGNATSNADLRSYFYTPNYDVVNRITPHKNTIGIVPDVLSGNSGLFNANNVAALQIPIYDVSARLKGTLQHICYAGTSLSTVSNTTPVLADGSMYVADRLMVGVATGGFYFYLGELE